MFEPMTPSKPVFPAPDHDHGRCAEDAFAHAERICAARGQKFTPIRRQVLGALLASHRPLGAYEVIDALARTMPRPAPITVYRALDFLMENGLVHRIESRNAFLACAHITTTSGGCVPISRGAARRECPARLAHSFAEAARSAGFAQAVGVRDHRQPAAIAQKAHATAGQRHSRHEAPPPNVVAAVESRGVR